LKEPFVSLYDRLFDDVYRYVYSKIGNRWDTDDLVSDIFRKAYEKYGQLKEDGRSKAWLITIARNTVIDFYRARRTTLGEEHLAYLPDPEVLEDRVAGSDELHCLKQAIALLPEDDREMVRLKYFGELKYREIGEIIGKTEENVKTRMFRLLKKLGMVVRHCLEGVNASG